MDTVSVPLWPIAYKEPDFRRLAFSPDLSQPITRLLAVFPLQNLGLTESESHTRCLAEGTAMLYTSQASLVEAEGQEVTWY